MLARRDNLHNHRSLRKAEAEPRSCLNAPGLTVFFMAFGRRRIFIPSAFATMAAPLRLCSMARANGSSPMSKKKRACSDALEHAGGGHVGIL